MKCKYEGTGVWEGRCTGTKEVDPCPGYDKCEKYKPATERFTANQYGKCAKAHSELCEKYEKCQLCPHMQAAMQRLAYYEEHVVMCKDCVIPHNKWTGCPNLGGLVPPENFFCAFGERRPQ